MGIGGTIMMKLGRRDLLLGAAGIGALAVMPSVTYANTYTALRDQVFTLAGSKYAQSNSRITSQTAYPSLTPSPTGRWNTTNSSVWTSGFYPGSFWHLYEWSKNATWKTIAQSREAGIAGQRYNNTTHDLGFMLYDSFGQDYRLTGNTTARNYCIQAAATLATRYNATVGCIRSWDSINDTTQFRVIIDNMMNLELLLWGSKQPGGSANWKSMAISHATKTLANHVRSDGTTFHVVNYNQRTGAVISKYTVQGYSNSSTWSRGQAWALYGFAIVYRETGNSTFLTGARRTADAFLRLLGFDSTGNLSSDPVPYWDFFAPATLASSLADKDSSAGAIAASGLLELSKLEADSTRKARYANAAATILKKLTTADYLASTSEGEALLKHGTASRPANNYNTGLVYGDYFLLEAFLKLGQLP
jgi:unsaturated chondroitin disaccharide hydrolase